MLESLADDIAFESDEVIHFRMTEALARAFDSLNLFWGHGQKIPVNRDKILKLKKAYVLEEYASFKSADLYESGALSYNESNEGRLSCGRYCSLGGGMHVFGERHPVEWVSTSGFTYCFKKNWNKPQFIRFQQRELGGVNEPVMPDRLEGPYPVLGHDVWLGSGVSMARGITIHSGAIVAANSVVTKDVAPYTIVGGNPARFIRHRFPVEVGERLLASQWWRYNPSILYEFGFQDPARFCDGIEPRIKAGDLPIWNVRKITWTDIVDAMRTVEPAPAA